MCGIYGVVSEHAPHGPDPATLDRMAAALHHRGPDGHGRHCEEGAALGVTRLRVVDHDPRADQPFINPDRDVALAVNGEIYNAPELRRRYRRYPFRSRSDVECILPLYLDRGPEGLAELDGMFAVALWDRRDRSLVLARDRAGEKPLFYARLGHTLVFASELAALLAGESIPRRLDRRAAAGLVANGYVPEPRTMFAGVHQVPAGTIVSFGRAGERSHRYWRPESIAPTSRVDVPLLRRAIEAAVARQTAADVPVGVFTSGGVDSSVLAAIAARTLGNERITTFSVGFPERSYDERRYASLLAEALGVRLVTVEAGHAAMRDVLDDLLRLGDAIADPAAMPTALLARAAREHVTVVLSGEGGDELFGGYPTYLGHRLAHRYAALPGPVRRAVEGLAALVPSSPKRVSLEYLFKRFAAEAGQPWAQRHLAWFGSGLPQDVLRTPWPDGPDPPANGVDDVVAAAMRLDYSTALRDRFLVKVDRATMLASLEARAPYLDPHVTQTALSLPGCAHVRGLTTKRAFKEVARAWVPEFILRRRKRGLSVPVTSWLNGPLADETDRLLDRARLDRSGIVDGVVVARLLGEHRAGVANHGRGLWTLFVLERWMEIWEPEV